MGTITKNFSYREFETTKHTEYKYKNMINSVEVRDNIKALAENVLQPLRDAYGKAMVVNSGYRCKELNEQVGGVPTSQHCKGEAADIHADCPIEMARLAIKLGLPYDQLIVYPTFVHFSHKRNGGNRGQVLYNKSYKGERV